MQAQQTDDQFFTLFGIRHGCLAMSLYFYFLFIIIWIIFIIIQNCIHSIHNIMQSTTRTRDKALQFDVYLNNKARNSFELRLKLIFNVLSSQLLAAT